MRVYLDELGEIEQLPIGIGLMVLTTLEGDAAKPKLDRRSNVLVAIRQSRRYANEI